MKILMTHTALIGFCLSLGYCVGLMLIGKLRKERELKALAEWLNKRNPDYVDPETVNIKPRNN